MQMKRTQLPLASCAFTYILPGKADPAQHQAFVFSTVACINLTQEHPEAQLPVVY